MPNGFPGLFVQAFVETAKVHVAAPDVLAEMDEKGREARKPSTQRCFISPDNKLIWNERLKGWRPRQDFADPPIRASSQTFLEFLAAKLNAVGSRAGIREMRALEEGIVCSHVFNSNHVGKLGAMRVTFRLEIGRLYFCTKGSAYMVRLEDYVPEQGQMVWYDKIELKKSDPVVAMVKDFPIAVLQFGNPRILKRMLMMSKAARSVVLVFETEREQKSIFDSLALLLAQVDIKNVIKVYRKKHKAAEPDEEELDKGQKNLGEFEFEAE